MQLSDYGLLLLFKCDDHDYGHQDCDPRTVMRMSLASKADHQKGYEVNHTEGQLAKDGFEECAVVSRVLIRLKILVFKVIFHLLFLDIGVLLLSSQLCHQSAQNLYLREEPFEK